MQCMIVFSVQEDGALVTTVKSTRSYFHARCAGRCFLRQTIVVHSGYIVCNETLAAEIVFL
eukprot:1101431-Karenia_brevis.AAC.1